MNKKELTEVYNFYKNCSKGFVTRDGYAAVPIGGKSSLMVIYSGERLKACRNEKSAQNFIKKHRSQVKVGTVFVK
jgi:hypothetical protein